MLIYTHMLCDWKTEFQVPMNNGMQPEYGFNVQPEQSAVPYGFNPQPPMSPYSPGEQIRPEGYPSTPQFATTLLAEPMVTNMAMQYGNALVGSGKQQLEKYVPVTALKYYFAVDTDYVFVKLAMLFFPFTHKVSCERHFCQD